MTLSKEQLERLYSELKAFKESYAHTYMKEQLDRDILLAAEALANDPRMEVAEMHFRRGAIHAARAQKNLVETLLMGVENQLLLLKADLPQKPLNATA
jgi:hypothetical protein